jgi:Concanavalin A-like lectin/glucanases superfamily
MYVKDLRPGVQAFAIGITGPGDQFVQRNSVTVREMNTWYHVAGVYDAVARTLDIYVNGVLDNGELSGPVPSQVNSAASASIGRRTGGFHFAGVIDDVRVYNRPLSAGEIVADMNTPPDGPDAQAPTAPGTPAPVVVSTTQINVTWTAATDNVGVTGYVLERCQAAGCTAFAPIATPTALSFVDTGVLPATTYKYRVRATDAAGNLSAYSGEMTATTPMTGVTPPAFSIETHSSTDGCCGLFYNNATLSLNVTGNNTILIVAWHSEWDGGPGATPTPPDPEAWSVTNNGVPGTVVVEANGYTGADGNRRFRIYYWLNPAPGINTINVSNPNTGANELSVVGMLFTNVDQTNPIGDVGLDVSTIERSSETETVNSTSNDLVLHVIADALDVRGTLGPGGTAVAMANDGLHRFPAMRACGSRPGPASCRRRRFRRVGGRLASSTASPSFSTARRIETASAPAAVALNVRNSRHAHAAHVAHGGGIGRDAGLAEGQTHRLEELERVE